MRWIAGGVGGFVALLLFVVLAGAGMQVNASQPPPGGCGVAPPGTGAGAPTGPQQNTPLGADQVTVARTVIGVGKGMGISPRGTAIALGTAMQESTLNPSATSPGGRSLGLFQQQGALYAGVHRDDPVDASRAFYEQLQARVPDYANPAAVPFDQAAQRVQASGAGAGWYARWEQWASTLSTQLYTGAPPAPAGPAAGAAAQCAPGGGAGPVPVSLHGTHLDTTNHGQPLALDFPNPAAARAAAAGLSYVGTPYAWGGGTANGPSTGIRDGGVADAHGDYAKSGFDCAGLTVYSYAQAQVTLTRPASAQLSNARTLVPFSQAQPGDLLFWGQPAHHVALYLGAPGGTPLMLEAPQSGDTVTISPVRMASSDFVPTVARPTG